MRSAGFDQYNKRGINKSVIKSAENSNKLKLIGALFRLTRYFGVYQTMAREGLEKVNIFNYF